ncbi:hypothetical protein [Salinisphaera sp. G21_0]|uniref:hypothetical protein n=1 Tax=Salinisphaera sp. G21_0 TaxID=2821094 RepID=UPI001AD9BAB0|nr:hypothetical protein [Salinisphaera sp. G21_0]MBO9482196.1 hypothetical protein [Salinisphaera sp. G21_0]
MNSVELGALNAMSYCWNKHDDSFILARAVKAIAGVVKATFTKYTVSLIEAEAVMKRHPDAWFAEPVTWALAKYKITHATDTSRQPVTASSSPASSATAGSPPPLPRTPRVSEYSPYSFSLNEMVKTRVQFINEECRTSEEAVIVAYQKMRAAAGELWVENAKVTCDEVRIDEVDEIVFGNKNHHVMSKYKIIIHQPIGGGCTVEEVLKLRDKSNGQMKLVRIGSFSETVGVSTAGGAGFPGYSDQSSIKAGRYLQQLKFKDEKGVDRYPYRDTQFGIGSPITDDQKIRGFWSCGFDALRLGIYQATGYKFSFLVLVAFLEEMISSTTNAAQLRQWFSQHDYPFGDVAMELLASDIPKSPDYPFFLKEKESKGAKELPEERKNAEGFDICERSKILTTNWDCTSTAILGQPAHAYGVYRNRKSDGTFEYMVYDPHNFERRPDFYISDCGQGRMSFATAEDAINHVTTDKGGCNGHLDAFYRLPDSTMCYLRDKMLETKKRLEENGTGY